LPTRSRRNPIRSAGKDKTRSCCNNMVSSEPPRKAGRDHKNAATNATKQRDQTLMQHQTKLGIGILSRFCKFVAFPLRNEAQLRACARVCASKRDQQFQWPHTRETTNWVVQHTYWLTKLLMPL
jgi:hypothetical protein